jgi:hypothetical protein
MSNLSMGLDATLNCLSKVALSEYLAYHIEMGVVVPTDENREMRVLFDDINGDIDNCPCSVHHFLLLPKLDQHRIHTVLKLAPAEV